MAFTLTDTQFTTLSVHFVDKRGNPANPPAFTAIPVWLVDNPNLLALEPSVDGLSCKVSTMGPLGAAVVSFKASGGGQDFVGSVDVTVTGGDAQNVVIDPGTPAEEP